MKVLKGGFHVTFGDLQAGDTFLDSDGNPHIKVAQSAASRLPAPPHSSVDLETGILYVCPDETKVTKVELGITGLWGGENGN